MIERVKRGARFEYSLFYERLRKLEPWKRRKAPPNLGETLTLPGFNFSHIPTEVAVDREKVKTLSITYVQADGMRQRAERKTRSFQQWVRICEMMKPHAEKRADITLGEALELEKAKASVTGANKVS